MNANPYSKSVRAGDFVFVAGHVSTAEGLEAQLEDCIQQVRAALERNGAGLDQVVRVGVFLRHREDFARMNAVYVQSFTGSPLPVRTTIGGCDFTRLDTLVEIDCVAHAPVSSNRRGN